MLTNLLTNLWTDLHEINVWWQLVTIALCVLTSYFVSCVLRRRYPAETHTSEANEEEIVADRLFTNIFFPGALLVFLSLGKLILLKWQRAELLSFLVVVYGAIVLMRFGIYLSRRIFVRNHQIGSTHLFIENVFAWGVWLVAILYYTGLSQDILAFMDANTIFIGRNKLTLLEIVKAIISVVVTVILALLASAALERRLMKVNSLHTSLRMVLSRLGRSLLILFAVLISLDLVGIDITILSVFGGALGVGLGLGLQKIASNYVSGFIILLDRSLSINDLITVDKYSGRVSKISTRYTVLKGSDGVESIIPNEMLVSGPVQNLSLTDREILISTNLTVAYSTDIEALLPMLIEVVSSVKRVSRKLLPSAYLISFGANGLELNIQFWISDPENGKTGVLSQVNRAIWKLLQEQKIEVPYPQTEIRVLNTKE